MLRDISVQKWLDALATETATPGGGSSCALIGAMGAALVAMVCRLSLARGAEGERRDRLRHALEEAERLRCRLSELVEEDIAAYEAVMLGYALPRASTEQQQHRSAVVQEALRRATVVPLECARASAGVLALAATVAEEGQPSALGEAGVAAEAARAALRASALNVAINLVSIHDQGFVELQRAELGGIQGRCQDVDVRIQSVLSRRLG